MKMHPAAPDSVLGVWNARACFENLPECFVNVLVHDCRICISTETERREEQGDIRGSLLQEVTMEGVVIEHWLIIRDKG